MAFQPSDATMFENLDQDGDDDSDGFEEDQRRENVSNIVSTSYATVDDGPNDYVPRDRTYTRPDRWAATAAHVRKRIQSTKRHTKGALRKRYNDIVTKREHRTDHAGGQQLPVYEVPLQVAVQRSVLNQGIQLPTVVRHCIDHLEECGLEHQGLYRLSGQKSKVEAIKTAYDNGDDIDLCDYTPDEVAGALKLYLRDLPSNIMDPILNEVDQLITSTDLDVPTRCRMVNEMMETQLAPCNYSLVAWLCIHLSHVIAKADINKMKSANLVIVFSPTLGLSQPTLNFFFTYTDDVFRGVELRRYVVPSLDDTRLFAEQELDGMDPSELTWQLIKTEDLLTQLHKDLHTLTESEKQSKSDMIWSYQRQVTDIKRLLRTRAKTMLKSGSTLSSHGEAPDSSRSTDESAAEDWESLQMIVLETLERETLKLMAMESSLREQIKQEKDWTGMVKDQINALPAPEEEPTSDEDYPTHSRLQSEVEQWQHANESLISDLALELEQGARLEARIAALGNNSALSSSSST